jgi:hypothetical protein
VLRLQPRDGFVVVSFFVLMAFPERLARPLEHVVVEPQLCFSIPAQLRLLREWPELFYDGLLSAIFTYGTILVEGAFPLLVWFRRTKMPLVFALASLHIGIAIFLQNVTFFSLSTVCALVVFVPPALTRAWASRLSSAE